LEEELDRIRNEWKSCQFVPGRRWVHSSLVPYDLSQCRRSPCPSHVDEGGGVALDSQFLKGERAYGPSHVVDGGGDALQELSGDMDRSSPGTDRPVLASGSGVGSGSLPGLGLVEIGVCHVGTPSYT
jgi:hypothetical protein